MKKMRRKLPLILVIMMVLTIIPGKESVFADSTDYSITLEMDKNYPYDQLLHTAVGPSAGTVTSTGSYISSLSYFSTDITTKTLTTDGSQFTVMPIFFLLRTSHSGEYTLYISLKYSANDFVITNPYTSTNLQTDMQDKALTYTLKRPIVDGPAPTVTYMSSNTSVLTVDTSGLFHIVAAGSATITATLHYGDGNILSKELNYTVSAPAPSQPVVQPTTQAVEVHTWTASWNVSSSTLQVGKKTTAIKPVLEDGDSVQSYTSSNPKVAAINSTGKISALKAGTTVLTVKTANGAAASMNLTCKKGKVLIKSITLPDTALSLKVRDTYTIRAVVSPISSSEKLMYSSSDKKIAKVSSSGKITARKAGTCTIKVKSQNKTKRITVTVTN